MFNNVTNAVSEYQRTLNEMKVNLRAEFIEKLKVDCTELKAHFPDLDFIFILGYTPKWNDGEECTHTSEMFIIYDDPRTWDTVEEYIERLYWRDEDECPTEYKNANKNLSVNDSVKVKDLLLASKFEDGLEVVYETDFNIVIDLTGSNIEVTVKDYECGH